jgi:hypothetical protein
MKPEPQIQAVTTFSTASRPALRVGARSSVRLIRPLGQQTCELAISVFERLILSQRSSANNACAEGIEDGIKAEDRLTDTLVDLLRCGKERDSLASDWINAGYHPI